MGHSDKLYLVLIYYLFEEVTFTLIGYFYARILATKFWGNFLEGRGRRGWVGLLGLGVVFSVCLLQKSEYASAPFKHTF